MSDVIKILSPAPVQNVVVRSEAPAQHVTVKTPAQELTKKITLTDFAGGYRYIGRAYFGTAEDAAAWRISRYLVNAAGEILEKITLTGVKWTERLTIF